MKMIAIPCLNKEDDDDDNESVARERQSRECAGAGRRAKRDNYVTNNDPKIK